MTAEATAAPTPGPGAAFKDEGNVHFKAQEFLKAAASYTKAIKAEPDNHVFYSNRSQAFLKLSKVNKALEDAEKCISLNPSFVKGYHRKASALHAGERTDDAVEVLLTAIEMGLDNNELVRMGIQIKGKAFVPLAAARKPGGPAPTEGKENKEAAPAPAEPPAKKAATPAAANAAPAAPGAGKQHLYQLDPESFAGLMIKDVFTEVLEKKQVPTIVYLQPGPPQPGQTEEPGLAGVGIEHAFSSPQTLANCTEFLGKHIADTKSQSAMVVVRKNHVQYPCTWKGKSGPGKWPCDERKDGIVMQLEAKGARALFFTEITKQGGGYAVGETHQLDAEEFALFPRLF